MNDFASSTPPPSSRQATGREFIAVVFRRKWIVVGLFAVTTLTVLTISIATPVTWLSSGRVLLKRGEQLSVLEPDRRIFGEWEQELGTEVQMVKSVPVLEEATGLLQRRAGRGATAPGIRPEDVDVEVLGKTNVIAIGYHDRDPGVAQTVCDAVIRAYIDYRTRQMGIEYPRQFFTSEIGKVRTRMAQLNQERERYYREHGLVDVEEQKRQLLAQLTSSEQGKVVVKADLADAYETVKVMKSLRDQGGSDLPVSSNVGGSDALFLLKQKIIEQEVRLAQLRERYRDESPDVENAATTLDTLRSVLRGEVDQRLAVLNARTQVLESRLASYERSIAAVTQRLDQMPADEAQVNTIEQELATLKERERQIVEKDDEARVNDNIVPRSSLILLSGAGPAKPASTRDYVRLALVPAFSLVVGVGLAFFVDGLDITVHTPSQAEEAIEVPVLATLPERRRRSG